MFKVDLAQEINSELEARRQQALSSAESCIKLLKQMGATEVLLCGSLAGQSPWHWHSDLDLAVKGMSKSDVWDAYSAVEEIVPHWLEVDIIPLEFAPSFLTERILSKTPMPDNKYLALKLRIRDEMNSLEITVSTINRALAEMNDVSEIFVAPALASYIADFYNGCERVSERVAVYLDGGIPRTKDWHLELLKLMAEPGGCDRPPLWSGALLLDLSEYRKFRHLTRHIYQVDLDRERVIVLAQDVSGVFNQIRLAVETFIVWLEREGK
jgi:predicted nucleotidyltransferase